MNSVVIMWSSLNEKSSNFNTRAGRVAEKKQWFSISTKIKQKKLDFAGITHGGVEAKETGLL